MSATGQVRALDVNGDGKVDIVTANNHSRNLSIVLGNGNGTFAAASNYKMGWDTRTVTLGDLNGDGALDLIGGDSNSDVRVFIGNGDGTFGSYTSYPDTGINRTGMEVADLDGDLNLDLVVSNRDTSDISVFLGNGTGALTPLARYGVGGSAQNLTVADFNGDGNPDVAVANSSGFAAVLLGTGSGTLMPAVSYPAGSVPLSVAAADFNLDGAQDLVLANQGGHNYSVLQGDGTGSFSAPTNYPSPLVTGVVNTPTQALAGDLNGDGKADVLLVNRITRNVSVMVNTTVVAVTCSAGSYLASPSDTECTPAPAGSYVAADGATEATLCAVGTYSDAPGAVACNASPAGSFVATVGASSATLCSPGTYADTVGAAACTPAPAGFYVPNAGASSAIACPAGFGSNAGATSCFALDNDGDGVNNDVDAYPNSNMGATVSVGACVTGVANQVLPNGATFNDLIASIGGANHGAKVSGVSQLSNGWKSAGLISGRDHGAIVSCTAKSK